MFKRRTSGVYVSIITLALALIGQMLIINNQPLTGGFNGLADLAPLSVGGIEFDPYGKSVYYLVAAALLGAVPVFGEPAPARSVAVAADSPLTPQRLRVPLALDDAELAAHFAPLAKALADNEQKIIDELAAVQGKPADIGGYYRADEAKVEAVMRPSATLNALLA